MAYRSRDARKVANRAAAYGDQKTHDRYNLCANALARRGR
jgi:hypothetical protein